VAQSARTGHLLEDFYAIVRVYLGDRHADGVGAYVNGCCCLGCLSRLLCGAQDGPPFEVPAIRG
jgi:hypothetical protein